MNAFPIYDNHKVSVDHTSAYQTTAHYAKATVDIWQQWLWWRVVKCLPGCHTRDVKWCSCLPTLHRQHCTADMHHAPPRPVHLAHKTSSCPAQPGQTEQPISEATRKLLCSTVLEMLYCQCYSSQLCSHSNIYCTRFSRFFPHARCRGNDKELDGIDASIQNNRLHCHAGTDIE